MHLYILNSDRVAIPVDDVETWNVWLNAHWDTDRRVAMNIIAPDISVSTIFLAIDHSFGFSKLPILFETAVWDTRKHATKLPDGTLRLNASLSDQIRYATYDEALAGHNAICEKLRNIIASQCHDVST